MTSARELVEELATAGVSLWTEGSHLRFRSTQPLRDHHRAELLRLKPAILELLTRKEAGPQFEEATGKAVCASCGGAMDAGRRYQCPACAQRFTAAPAPQEPHLAPDGGLRIPFGAPARFRWWAGGQPPHTTALELGASQAQAWLYTSPFSHGQKPEGIA